MNQEKLNDVMRLHKMWLNNEDGGVRANLRRANLTGADLTDGADLDFSSWPLCCGSLGVKVDERIKRQLLYHVIDAVGVDFFTDQQIEEANKFHCVGEVPTLTKKEAK